MAASPEVPVRDLTPAEVSALKSDGVVCIRQVIPASWLDRIAAGIESCYEDPTATNDLVSMRDQGFMSDLFMWLHDDNFRAIVFESPVARLAQQALGTDAVTHFYDQLFVKEPGAQVPTPWHHDLTYWPVRGDQIVSFWISLDPVSRETSGLEFVRGSHRWTKRFKALTNDYNAYMIDPELDDTPDIDANRDDFDLVSWDIEPGDALVFHPLIVHGSSGNSSTSIRRRALASRWAGGDVVYAPRPHTMPFPRDHDLRAGDHLGGPVFPSPLGP